MLHSSSVGTMKWKEENCEVGVVLEMNSVIVLSMDKVILCLCGKKQRTPFERGKLRKREEQQSNTARTEAVLTPPPPAPPLAFRQPPLWQFPPPLPPPYVYTNDQDNLQPIGNERASFRNLKKNIGGRWKRLVKRKPEPEVYSIPPELKPQLKQIYVY